MLCQIRCWVGAHNNVKGDGRWWDTINLLSVHSLSIWKFFFYMHWQIQMGEYRIHLLLYNDMIIKEYKSFVRGGAKSHLAFEGLKELYRNFFVNLLKTWRKTNLPWRIYLQFFYKALFTEVFLHWNLEHD